LSKPTNSYKEQRRNEKLEEAARKKKIRIGMMIAGGLIAIAVIVLAVIQANQPAKGYAFNYSAQPSIGQAAAPVKIVEFGDFKCPQCKLFADNVYPLLKKEFIDTGKVQMYFNNFSFIRGSRPAAIAAESVYHQNKEAFWSFYDAIYKNQGDENADWATSEYLTNLAKTEKLPVDYDLLKKDIDNNVYDKDVSSDNSIASKANVSGTPTLFINGFVIQYDVTMDYSKLKAAIEKELQK
jgi:protein-disulfide isomerase